MSSDRNAQGRPPPGKPTLPTLAARRSGAPLTPRVAANATPPTTAGRTPTIRAAAPTTTTRPRLPQVRVAETAANNNNKDGHRNAGPTPRAYIRTTRATSPSNVSASSGVSPNNVRGRPVVAAPNGARERTGHSVGLGIGAGPQSRPRVGQARSIVSEGGSLRGAPTLVRAPVHNDSGHSQVDGVDSRFFHASDATKQEPTVRRPSTLR